jgi:hypothetical protein
MSSTAVFVDVPQLYKAALEKNNQRVDYVAYMDWLRQTFDVRYAKAFCNQNAATFRRMLNNIGLEVEYDKFSHSYQLLLEALEVAKNYDTIVIGSTGYYVPLLAQRLKAMGKKVIIFACSIPTRYKTFGETYEVAAFTPAPQVSQTLEQAPVSADTVALEEVKV